MNDLEYTEYPSGRVLCSLRVDGGAIVCLSDSTDGPYEKRAQEAAEKVNAAYVRWSQPVGKMVDVVV